MITKEYNKTKLFFKIFDENNYSSCFLLEKTRHINFAFCYILENIETYHLRKIIDICFSVKDKNDIDNIHEQCKKYIKENNFTSNVNNVNLILLNFMETTNILKTVIENYYMWYKDMDKGE